MQDNISVYGHVALYSPTIGLKCYAYRCIEEILHSIDYFKEIDPKDFKMRSAIRSYLTQI